MRYYLFLLLLSCWLTLGAQTSQCTGPSYAQFHRDAGGRDVRLTCLIDYLGDGDLLLGGMLGGDIYLSRRGATGERRWQRTFATGGESTELTTLNALLVDREGMIAGTGSVFRDGTQHAFLFRYDPVSERLLYLREAAFGSDPNTLLEDGEGNYLITGARLDFPAPLFLRAYQQRFDRRTGLPLRPGQMLDVDGDERIFDAVPHPAGGYVVTGQAVQGGGAGAVRTMMARMDVNGSLSQALVGPVARGTNARLFGYDIEVVGDRVYVLQWGDIGVLTGSLNTAPILTATDLNGEVLWTRKLDVMDYDGEAGLELEPHAGGLLIYGYALGKERDIFLLQTDLEGRPQWANAYLFPGRVLLYVRANQQLRVSPTSISVLATYVFNGERGHEGLLLQLAADGATLSSCVERRPLTVTTETIEAVWSPVSFTAEGFGATFTDLGAQPPSALDLALTDDCDIPCPDCSRQSFTTLSICAGDSVEVAGRWRRRAGIYRDTVAASGGQCDSVAITEVVLTGGPAATYQQVQSCGLPTAEVRILASGGEAPYTYTWSDPSAQGATALLAAGEYTVTVTDALACAPTVLPVTVTVDGEPFQLQAEAPSCFGGADGAVRLQPVGRGSLRLLRDSSYQADARTGLAAGSYSVIVRTADGCEVFREIFVPEAPRLRIDLEGPTSVRLGTATRYTIILEGTTPPVTYAWTPAARVDCEDCDEVLASFARDTVLRVTATDAAGCTVADSLFIRVLEGEPRIYLPNAFSPNGDGQNDDWVPSFGPEVAGIASWQVYDRWGGEIWRFEAAQRTPWSGGDAGSGVYLYRIVVRLVNGRLVEQTGSVTLVR